MIIMRMFSHPNALENLYKAQVKKYKTPKTNIGFIRHMYVAIFIVYTSAVPGI